MATVRDLIAGALRLLGVVDAQTPLSADQAADGLTALNAMLASWSTQRLAVYTILRQVFPLINGQQAYTLGAGGDFDVARPARIEQASVLVQTASPDVEIPIDMLTVEGWQNQTVKQVSSTFPLAIYPDGAFPLNTIYCWPIPAGPCSLVLYNWAPYLSTSSLNSQVQFPPGYERAIRFNLAKEMAAEFGLEPSPTVRETALTSLDTLFNMNHTPLEMSLDDAIVGSNGLAIAQRSRGYVVDP